MNYLLDTHIILWWLTEPEKIATTARKIISDKKEQIYLSGASFWEMAIKQSIGRLKLPVNIIEVLVSEGFETLPIMPQECLSVADLPPIHHDPFDRMLVVQAKLNDLVLITKDEKIISYPVLTLRG
ncbi:MAG: type II toxin-antitoxin system VapC family toxin [Candidatus Berkiellales bacterium]